MRVGQSGRLSFLFTDIEGSTGLWEEDPRAMKAALELHDGLLRLAVERQGGRARAALDQLPLEEVPLRARMALERRGRGRGSAPALGRPPWRSSFCR
ncbi:MAG: hypothetical protein ACRD02_07145 [Acidimicrobiia bacterium]